MSEDAHSRECWIEAIGIGCTGVPEYRIHTESGGREYNILVCVEHARVYERAVRDRHSTIQSVHSLA